MGEIFLDWNILSFFILCWMGGMGYLFAALFFRDFYEMFEYYHHPSAEEDGAHSPPTPEGVKPSCPPPAKTLPTGEPLPDFLKNSPHFQSKEGIVTAPASIPPPSPLEPSVGSEESLPFECSLPIEPFRRHLFFATFFSLSGILGIVLVAWGEKQGFAPPWEFLASPPALLVMTLSLALSGSILLRQSVFSLFYPVPHLPPANG